MIPKKAIPPKCINLVPQKFYIPIIKDLKILAPPKVFHFPLLGQ